MSRLPLPHRPYTEMTWLERRQYVEARLWFSHELEVCFVCESELDLHPYEGAYVCSGCKDELESVVDGPDGLFSAGAPDDPLLGGGER